MKPTLRLSLVAVTLGLSAAAFLRADDQPASPPPASPPSDTTPPSGEQGQRRGGRMSPERMLQMMSNRLNLTDDQKAKILPVLQSQFDQMKALRDDTSLSDDDKRDKRRSIMQDTHQKIRALLTPDQQQQFDSMRGPGGRGEHNGPPPSAGDQPPPPPPASGDQPPPAPPPSE